jgi:predicted component of type VI protein secretion system
MILKRNSGQSARWDHKNNQWWIGESQEYQWCTTDKEKPVSPWLLFDDALIWIKDYDEKH